jgi:hypothetical protein
VDASGQGTTSTTTVDFGLMPVYMGCVESNTQEDQFWHMKWGLNSQGLLRVIEPPALELVYPEQHSDPFPSKTWMDHHVAFTDHVIRGIVDGNVLEIGAAHGILAKMVQSQVPNVDWTIIEPNPVIVPGVRAKLVSGWFPDDLPDEPRLWPNIVASHVLEHAVDPYQFLSDCFGRLEQGGHLVISWPDMLEMARRTDLNMMNFEHLTFLPIATVASMLDAIGFRTLNIEMFRGHSVFITAAKSGSAVQQETYLEFNSEKHLEMAQRYKADLAQRVSLFNAEIRARNGDIWLFGAHIFSQFLIAGGLEIERVKGLLDNAPSKQGKRLYGTNLSVYSPDQLKFEKPGLILIAAALYENEIIAQLRDLELSDFEIVSSQNGNIKL